MTLRASRLDGIRDRLRGLMRRRKEIEQETSSKGGKPLSNSASDDTITFPIFRLPQEIREQIWRHLIADHALHISNPSSERITHIICRAPISSILAPYISAHASQKPPPDDGSNPVPQLELGPSSLIQPTPKTPTVNAHSDPRFRHSGCFIDSRAMIEAAATTSVPADWDPDLRETILRAQLPLAILRTCRTIHEEASRVLWTENWFMFAKSRTFVDFLSHRTPIQRDWIRHLVLRPIPHLCFTTVPSEPYRRSARNYPGISIDPLWKEALSMLPNLKELCLTASYNLTAEDLKRIWVDERLVDEGAEVAGIDIVDELESKKSLVGFWPQVLSSMIWFTDPDDGRYHLRNGDERINGLLEALLRERVTGRKYVRAKRDGEEGMDDDMVKERRTKSLEKYLRDVLIYPSIRI